MVAGCGQKKTPENAVEAAADQQEETTDVVVADSDEVITEGVLTGSEIISLSTWQAEDGSFIHVSDGGFYTCYDKDGKKDGPIGFWKKLDDVSISLMDNKLNEVGTLINEDSDTDIIVDGDGHEYIKTTQVMDGGYSCMMNASYLNGDELTITETVPFWVPDSEVQTLEVGSILNNTDMEFMGTEIESLEKTDDTHYVINGNLDLIFDKNEGCWLFVSDSESYQQVGVCKITDDTVITDENDPEITTLEAAFEKYDFIHPIVLVENGAATLIDINEMA